MDIIRVLEETIDVARRAGAFIRKERQHFDLAKVELKGTNDMASYVDKQAEQILVERLSEIIPEAGFITEEGTSPDKREVYNRIIDPLEGSTDYSNDVPISARMIGRSAHADD